MKGNIFKLKPEKVEVWNTWAEYLKQHEAEVQATLREEHLAFEGSFVFQITDNTYVCLFGKSDGHDIVPAVQEKEINRKHRETMKECFAERIGPIDLKYFFEA